MGYNYPRIELTKDNRSNVKLKKETHDELNRYARKLSYELDSKITLDEAILHAIELQRSK